MSVTSDFYLARANECSREAEASTLDNVRERYLRAEAAWRAMAGRLQRGEQLRDEAATEKAARTEAAS
jgi:hypothetical protein